MAPAQGHHRIVVIGGGNAGIAVSARMLKSGEHDVAVVEPSDVHYYQPLRTLVGGGCAPAEKSVRTELSVMPKAATWIKDRAVEIDPDGQKVGLASGGSVGYDFLVICPGLALDWDRLAGATESLGRGVCRATTRWIWPPRRGSSSRICAGERRCSRCRRDRSSAPAPLRRLPSLGYDVAHLVPPQSAPACIKSGPLADPANPGGYVEIDKATMRHTRYPNVFSLGDAGSSPNSKTGAAIRKQAPVVVENLQAVMAGKEPSAVYDGYASCPLTTARNRMLLAEFDYTMKPHPTVPVIDTQKERYDMWLLKRYGLPFLYWSFITKGAA